MTNPLMDRQRAAPQGNHPVTEFDWQDWCAKMNEGHEFWGSDKFFFYLPSNHGGFYPKAIGYRAFGSAGAVIKPDNRHRATKYYRAAGVPETTLPAIFERAHRDYRRWQEQHDTN